MCAGAFDQSVVALRSDVLVFATPPARPSYRSHWAGLSRRYGLHAETDRCLSAERGLVAWLRSFPVANLLCRLEQQFPHFDVNLNSGEPRGSDSTVAAIPGLAGSVASATFPDPEESFPDEPI
jgi:hypothetical protein